MNQKIPLIDVKVAFFSNSIFQKNFFVSFPFFINENKVISFFEKQDNVFIDMFSENIHLSKELINKYTERKTVYLKRDSLTELCIYKGVKLIRCIFIKREITYIRYVLLSCELNEQQIFKQIYQLYPAIERLIKVEALNINCWNSTNN